MKILLVTLVLNFISISTFAQQSTNRIIDSTFTLSYISIGLGGNIWDLQPMFRVKGTSFVYTSEEAWEFKDSKRAKPDTLLAGSLRLSSIDSILTIATEVKGDSVYKLDAGITDGGMIYLDIKNKERKLHFNLTNSFDLTAKKIVDILNTYIPDKLDKLWISNRELTIIKIR